MTAEEGPDLELPPPVWDADAGQDARVGLFGAATAAGRINPTPVVYLGGQLVATARNPDGSLPAALAVESLSWEWGREHVLVQPDPPEARLTLFCPDPEWLRSRAATLIGTRLEIGYTWTGGPSADNRDTRPFRGRVATVRPRRLTLDGVAGVLVELTATHLLTDLANRRVTTNTQWPVETFPARVIRLNSYVTDVTQFGLRAYFDGAQAAALDADDRDALSLIRQMFDTTGADRMVYVPDQNRLYPANRRYYAFAGMARLWSTNAGPRAGTVYVEGNGITNPGTPFTSGPAMYLDADAVQLLEEPSLDASSRVSRVELRYRDATTGTDKTITKLVPGTNEATDGRRTLSVDTVHAWEAWADQTAGDFVSMAQVEGTAWTVGRMRWETSRTGGGFETIAQVDVLLGGHERGGYFVLNRGDLHDYGVLPFFGVIGGRTSYARGHWTVEFQPAPAVTSGGIPSVQLRHLAAPGYDFPLSLFHESVTLADLGRVSTGFGQTVTYPEGTP